MPYSYFKMKEGKEGKIYITQEITKNGTTHEYRFGMIGDSSNYVMVDYTQLQNGKMTAKGLQWKHKRLTENYYILINGAGNYLTAQQQPDEVSYKFSADSQD